MHKLYDNSLSANVLSWKFAELSYINYECSVFMVLCKNSYEGFLDKIT